jgi:hypothetical protein
MSLSFLSAAARPLPWLVAARGPLGSPAMGVAGRAGDRAAGGSAVRTGGGVASIRWPHTPQKRAPFSSELPQRGHVMARCSRDSPSGHSRPFPARLHHHLIAQITSSAAAMAMSAPATTQRHIPRPGILNGSGVMSSEPTQTRS